MLQTQSSASSFVINITGALVALAVVIFYGNFVEKADAFLTAFISLSAGIVVIIIGEIFFLKVHKRPSAGLCLPQTIDKNRVAIKKLGYFGSLAMLMMFYALIPEYNDEVYTSSFIFMLFLMIIFIIGGLIYIPEIDRRMTDPHDKLWHFGLMLCGQWSRVNLPMARSFIASVFLRGYFLPVMLMYLFYYIELVFSSQNEFLAEELGAFVNLSGIEILKFFIIGYFYLAAMDIFFAVVGYIVVLRGLDTHIRSVEPTFLGWFICIVCYFPFFQLILIDILLWELYNGGDWRDWFAGMPIFVIVIWGVFVVTAMLLESLSTLSFGLRFSNLTYRGLICTGLFGLTKHPQYVSKLLNRFFFFVPILSLGGFMGTAERLIIFGMVCLIYYLRARTEENHLSRYPEYVAYANKMNTKSVFVFVGKIFPFLVYSEGKAKAGKLF